MQKSEQSEQSEQSDSKSGRYARTLMDGQVVYLSEQFWLHCNQVRLMISEVVDDDWGRSADYPIDMDGFSSQGAAIMDVICGFCGDGGGSDDGALQRFCSDCSDILTSEMALQLLTLADRYDFSAFVIDYLSAYLLRSFDSMNVAEMRVLFQITDHGFSQDDLSRIAIEQTWFPFVLPRKSE